MNILRPTTQPLLCPMLLLQKEIRFFCLLIKVLLGGERDVAAAVVLQVAAVHLNQDMRYCSVEQQRCVGNLNE